MYIYILSQETFLDMSIDFVFFIVKATVMISRQTNLCNDPLLKLNCKQSATKDMSKLNRWATYLDLCVSL